MYTSILLQKCYLFKFMHALVDANLILSVNGTVSCTYIWNEIKQTKKIVFVRVVADVYNLYVGVEWWTCSCVTCVGQVCVWWFRYISPQIIHQLQKVETLFNQYSFSTTMPRTKPHGPKHSSTMFFPAEECDLHAGLSADLLQEFAGFPVINLENIPKELMGLN